MSKIIQTEAWKEADTQRGTDLTWHSGHVGRESRNSLLKQRGATLWFTGLSGSGKSTIGFTLEHMLVQMGRLAYVLDGDNVRQGLNKNLGFSAIDRAENIRRIGEVARLFADTGVITIASFISPYRNDRRQVRDMHEESGLPFIEVFVDASIDVCEQRDPKGLYKRARAGEIKFFTGISDPYEAPEEAEVVLDAGNQSPPECAELVISALRQRGLLGS
jgi:adenylylsulfate kinase